ncbi:hypothetical protein BH780_gp110 [Bacillus phage Eldridge]|uniref:Uncharacterized protein n=1 Tax=Bacillus phage Eldridge TaxID=1776293 RepID=A0A0Y0AFI9_9CAUD|nr:hypothetical protein BH780_gp110 [Bacillus phage Eldridge]AMB18693.1 hypothetical protein Eldridge_0113 [Bacillus phage Eldridge]
MEAANLSLEEAIAIMKMGYVMSPSLGSYDYYALKQTKTFDKSGTGLVLYGFDMDELTAVQPDELEVIEKATWHVISGPWEEYGE